MDFFDKLGQKISEGYNAAAEKTKEMANETKLKFAISDCKDKINEEYKKIGKSVYEMLLNDRDNEIALKLINEFKTVDGLNESIKKSEEEILSLNGKKKCEKCGAEIDKNATVCPKCGANIEVSEPQVFEGEVISSEEPKQ